MISTFSAFMQAQARPAQGAAVPPNPDPQVVSRLLQNMPTADVIGRTLGIDKAGTESLLSDGKQGRLYLARQLAVRQTGPGGALLQTATAQQQPAGDFAPHLSFDDSNNSNKIDNKNTTITTTSITTVIAFKVMTTIRVVIVSITVTVTIVIFAIIMRVVIPFFGSKMQT